MELCAICLEPCLTVIYLDCPCWQKAHKKCLQSWGRCLYGCSGDPASYIHNYERHILRYIDIVFMYILNRMTQSILWCLLMIAFCFACTFLVVLPIAVISLFNKGAQIRSVPLKITRIICVTNSPD